MDCTQGVEKLGEFCRPNNIKSPNLLTWNVYLFRSSLVSFNNVLQFLQDNFYAFLVKFIPLYFFIFMLL